MPSPQETIQQLEEKLRQKDQLLAAKELELKYVYERLRLELARRYGPKSEQLSEEERKQLSLFDEEAEFTEQEQEAIESDEAQVTVPEHTRKRSSAKKSFPDHLPREEVVHDLPESEKVCHCGACLKAMGDVVSEQLDIIPMQIKVIRHVEKKICLQGI